MLKEGIGYSREFQFDEPIAQLSRDLTVNDLRGQVTLTRTPQGLYAQGQLAATAPAECARCLTGLEQTLTTTLGELYIYPPENAPEGALTVGEDAYLDLTPVVREDMLLSIPMQSLCRPLCKGLCPQCGKNWNEGPCDCEDETIDPRLAGLADLLKKRPPE